MIFLDKVFFEKIRFIFDSQNWLWKYNFGTFWQTVITHSIFLKIFSWWHVDFWPKSLLFRFHHRWNSTTELILETWDSVPNEVFVGQKDINELQRRVKYETNVKDTIHLGQVLKAEKLYVDKKRLAFLSMLSSVSPECMQTCRWCL